MRSHGSATSDDNEVELLLLEPGSSRVFALPRQGRVILGRAPGCEIVIDDTSVSRRHAALEIADGMTVEDLGSANGTWLHTEQRDAGSSAAGGPMSTRPGMQALNPGERATLAIGQGLLVGAMLLVVRRRSAPGGASTARARGVNGNAPLLVDPQMKALYETAERVAASNISVLILGETGVGKELLAEAIHRASPRADKPLLCLHCAALSPALLESELFGHEQGAFTGAARAKTGLLQSADGGTVFLDEVGELPLDFQVKLLRFLEDRMLTRVGGTRAVRVDVRFIAATNRDLRTEVAARTFRQDLLYRLDGISLTIPPLRERPSEIPPLAARFTEEASLSLGLTRVPKLTAAGVDTLLRHDWPGNVRELRHVLERAVVLQRDGVLSPADLLPSFASQPQRSAAPGFVPVAPPAATALAGAEQSGSLRAEIADLERQRIEEALERAQGNQSRAAELLGMSRRTLVSRLAAFGFPRPRKRST